ncbi:MAG: HlyD family efflux transporter periplasmic adaptor subunit [Burkholderiales bacterium]
MQVKRSWVMGTASVALVGVLLAWAFAPRPTEVETATVSRGVFEQSIEEDGRTRLKQRYTVSAPIAAQVTRITLREGDPVQAGDTVATLQPVMSSMVDERSRSEALSRMEAARARVGIAQSGLERAGISLQDAWQEMLRNRQLADQGFVAASRLETSRLAVAAAVHGMQAAAAEREVAVHEQAVADAALQPPVTGASGQRQLTLRSPVGGVVLRVAQLNAATVPAGAALLDLGDPAHMEVLCELLTVDAAQVAVGHEVVVERWGGPAVQGRVRRVEPAAFTKVSALGVEEQRVNVLIDVLDPPAAWQSVGDGFRVGVRIISRRVDAAVLVPVGALFPHGDGFAVYLLEGQRSRLQPLKLWERNATVAWVQEGLSPGQSVVVYPPAQLSGGDAVRVRTP